MCTSLVSYIRPVQRTGNCVQMNGDESNQRRLRQRKDSDCTGIGLSMVTPPAITPERFSPLAALRVLYPSDADVSESRQQR
jgi:hypothetical protein